MVTLCNPSHTVVWGTSDDSHVPIGGLQVDRVLVDFINNEVLPRTGVARDRFWCGFQQTFSRFTERNRELLAERERLQAAIDAHLADGPVPPAEHAEFLRQVGYLVDEPADVRATTTDVDPEIATIAGPQLVVPVTNRRFAINAANARWGSLYDALYGTDAMAPIPTDGPYDPARGAKVIAWARDFLDVAVPLSGASHHDVVAYRGGAAFSAELGDGRTVELSDPTAYVGHIGDPAEPQHILVRHHGLHIDLCLDRTGRIGADDPAGVDDVVLESAVTAIMDFEDSVAAVDGADKVRGYRNWFLLNQGTAAEQIVTGDTAYTRVQADDRRVTAPDGGEMVLPGRVLMLCRNVGHLMTTPAVLDADGRELPEGILDALVTALCAIPGIDPENPRRNTRSGKIHIVKPKQHGPEEVAFTADLFAQVEQVLDLPPRTLTIGIMDEERRTSVNLAACIARAADRVIFINTGFLDRTGDEIHTAMAAGPMIRKAEMKQARWMGAYEDQNVDVGLATGLPGRAQIGKGMWAMTEQMGAMLEQKIGQPLAGASTAWVPSPTAATLHATHYHRVDVAARQRELLAGGRRAALAELLTLPVAADPSWSDAEKQEEVDNSCQSILGYVVRWVDQGVGCSKVPDIHDVALMEDRATCRISSQLLANWIHHGVVTAEFVVDRLRAMAPVVDRQNADDPRYRAMAPHVESSIAWCAARDLVLEGTRSPSGYTEPILHAARRRAKAARR